MFHHLLVAIDGSENSLHAADIAIELATLLHAGLDLLSIEETPPHYVSTQEEQLREHTAAVMYFDRLQAPLRQRSEHRGIETRCAVVSGHEGQAILRYIEEQHCDLLVLGYQGHSGVWGAFLGSTADKLASHAPCSTLIIRPTTGKSLFKRILVALDGSPLSWQAFTASVQLAQLFHATLHTVSVLEGRAAPPATGALPSLSTPAIDSAPWDWSAYFHKTQALATVQAHLAGLNVETITAEGSANSMLIAIAREQHSDVLILGATGHEHPWSAVIGGTARKVANEAPCAVLLVRPSVLQQHVRHVMSSSVSTINRNTPLSEVLRLLIEQGVKLLVVVDNNQGAQGVITLGHLFTSNERLRQANLYHMSGANQIGQLFDTRERAEDVMIRQPYVVKADTTIEAAARWMTSQRITRMPVVDNNNTLVGLLDQEAILGYYVNLPAVADSIPQTAPVFQKSRPQTVGEASLTQVPMINPDASFPEIVQRIQETPLHRVIVVARNGKAVGVIGDNDMLALQGTATHRNPLLALAGRYMPNLPEEMFRRRPSQRPLTAQQIMRPRLFTATPATSLVDAVHLMLSKHIKRLVIVNEEGKPLGLVDRQHLLRLLVEGGTPTP
ncbi:MAG TPA: universal stress protein [Ktedonobacteraceae bacterium]|nr:universal stress protein [Ktedonobacteraceae bacterium]